MITRTVTTSAINVKHFNLETEQVEDKIFTKPGKLSASEAEKKLTKEGIKVLKINSIDYSTELTAMSDEEWLQHCHTIPARGTKKA